MKQNTKVMINTEEKRYVTPQIDVVNIEVELTILAGIESLVNNNGENEW